MTATRRRERGSDEGVGDVDALPQREEPPPGQPRFMTEKEPRRRVKIGLAPAISYGIKSTQEA